jgi:signal transduction histidine kinase
VRWVYETGSSSFNLSVNAAHAIADNVGTDSNQKGRITVSTRKNGHWAEVDIRDMGKGIPPEIRSRVFESVFITKQVGQGTGQGLARAHSVIVKKHQGHFGLIAKKVSETFHIRLPLEASAVEQTAEHWR